MAHSGFTEINGQVPTTKGNLILLHVFPLSMSCRKVHLVFFFFTETHLSLSDTTKQFLWASGFGIHVI